MRASTELKYFRATFKDMKVAVLDRTEVVHCELEIELRQIPGRVDLYYLFWVNNGRVVSERRRTLRNAKEFARSLFIEQLTEWEPVDPASTLASPDTT